MDNSPPTKEQALHAIQLLYGGSTEQQSAASAWLNSFLTSPSAWQISIELINDCNAVEVQFFAANLILNKARREWLRLSAEERDHLLGIIRQEAYPS